MNFISTLTKNKTLKRVVSSILTASLLVSSALPVGAGEGTNNGEGSGGSITGSDVSGNYTATLGNGGYRFTLLFLAYDNTTVDRAGNTRIDAWEKTDANIQDFGYIDVAYNGKDDASNYFYDGSSFHFDFNPKGTKNRENYLKNSGRKFATVSDLGLTKFSWQIQGSMGETDMSKVLAVEDGTEPVNLDLYPDVPGSSVLSSQKYKLTEDCAKIIKAICEKNSTPMVSCISTDPNATGNVFEQGTFNGQNGSYRLLIEPYEVLNIGSTKVAMTLRDAMWYAENKDGFNNTPGGFTYNLGKYISLLTNVDYMPNRDIFGLNGTSVLPYNTSAKKLSDLQSLKAFPFSPDKSGSRLKDNIKPLLRDKKGYGISSISSEMTKVPTIGLYIGSVNNVFLPGTLSVNGSINTETESYSLEYRGQKIANYEEALANDAEKLMNIVIKAATESDIASVKNGIVTF